jgi:hypothetical protein
MCFIVQVEQRKSRSTASFLLALLRSPEYDQGRLAHRHVQRMENPYLFISHSSKDARATSYLADGLRDAGHRCWVDVAAIPDGSTWVREIEDGVRGCAALIVVMTEHSRASEWVEREALLALELKKPVFVARFDDAPLPIHLISRQASDFRKRKSPALRKLVAALETALAATPAPDPRPAPDPIKHAFFKYLEQFENGPENARIARELFLFTRAEADNLTFSGRSQPAFHAHIYIGLGGVVAYSLRAYPRQPAVEVPLQYFMEFPPYNERDERLKVLHALNELLPEGERLHDDRADRKPTVPLSAISDPARYAALLQTLTTLITTLRAAP